MALINANFNKSNVGLLAETPEEEIQNSAKIFIDTDEIYLLSLLHTQAATLLVSRNNELLRDLEIDDPDGNYIIVNSFTNQLLQKCKKDLKKGIQTKQAPAKVLDLEDDVPSKISLQKQNDDLKTSSHPPLILTDDDRPDQGDDIELF